jgi:hypothetical protein
MLCYDEGIVMKGLSLGMSWQMGMGMGELGKERECWQMGLAVFFMLWERRQLR